MPRRTTRTAGGAQLRAVGTAAEGATPRPAYDPRAPRGPRSSWTHIPVELLDLDQFDDDGRLISKPYRPYSTKRGGAA